VIGLWQLASSLSWISPLILPSPADIGAALVAGFTAAANSKVGWYMHIEATLAEALIGLAIGATLGVVMAGILAEVPAAWSLLSPYVVTLQVIPKLALAPLLVIWLGTGYAPTITIITMLTFFPMLVNSLAGFVIIDREKVEVMRSLGAGRGQIFWMVKVPSALPHLFSGLNIAVIFSLTGAVVGEFISGDVGLGSRIVTLTTVYDLPGVFAALCILAVLGVSLFGAVRLAQRRLLFWASELPDQPIGT
jgi:NitT/TauT family transport system permease protein